RIPDSEFADANGTNRLAPRCGLGGSPPTKTQPAVQNSGGFNQNPVTTGSGGRPPKTLSRDFGNLFIKNEQERPESMIFAKGYYQKREEHDESTRSRWFRSH